MARNVFSVPIFFIVFRETLEAAIIISVLLGLVEQIIHEDPALLPGAVPKEKTKEKEGERQPIDKDNSDSNSHEHELSGQPELPRTSSESPEEPQVDDKRLLRKMRLYIFAGAFLGLFLALAIGAAFIAVWFTQAADLWAKSEELWEGAYFMTWSERVRTLLTDRRIYVGIFELIASIIIFVMGVSMLKMDRAKAKWRVKLQRAFSGRSEFLLHIHCVAQVDSPFTTCSR